MDTGLIRPYSVIQWRCQWSAFCGWPSHSMCSRPHFTGKPDWPRADFAEKLSPATRIKGMRVEQISWKTVSRERGPRNYRDFAKNRTLGRHVREISEMGCQKMGSNMRPRYIRFRDMHDRDISGLHCSRLGTPCKIALRWMPYNLTNEKSTLIQVMAWCHQATSHYLNQCGPRSLMPYWATFDITATEIEMFSISKVIMKVIQISLSLVLSVPTDTKSCQLTLDQLNHWGGMTHICVSRLTIIGPDNGLSPGRRQAIIWTNAGILLIGPLGTNFSENLIRIQTFWFRKMPLKMLSAKWRPFCLGLNVLIVCHW